MAGEQRFTPGIDDSPRLRVGILGATGCVGQKFIKLLSGHPWFSVTALAASERSRGRSYGEAVRWLEPTLLPRWAARMPVGEPSPDMPCDLVFSALDAGVAQEVEPLFVAAGIPVISNASSFRNEPRVPLLVPEVNPNHLSLLGDPEPSPGSVGKAGARQGPRRGFIVTNPNCSTTGLVLALKPLFDAFSIDRISVTTLQAVSGAGYPGVPSMDILGNVLPEIFGEEEKLETEPLKIFGKIIGKLSGKISGPTAGPTAGPVAGQEPAQRMGSSVENASIAISAQCNRVPVSEGHLLSVSVGCKKKVGVAEAREALEGFRSPLVELGLPSAPRLPVSYSPAPEFPQPRLHAGIEGGMAVSVGRLRECPVLDLRFVALVHNTVRGAAGGAILNAEFLRAKGYLVSRG